MNVFSKRKSDPRADFVQDAVCCPCHQKTYSSTNDQQELPKSIAIALLRDHPLVTSVYHLLVKNSPPPVSTRDEVGELLTTTVKTVEILSSAPTGPT